MKRIHWFTPICLIAALLAPGIAASGQEDESQLFRLLSYAPDTPQTREYEVYFGDTAAWHASWRVPRVPDLDALDGLPRDPHAYWMFIMPHQTVPPDSLGIQYLMLGDMRLFYGFDFFLADRWMYFGAPPDNASVVESAMINEQQIGDRLTAAGYAADPLDDGWTLYSLNEDYSYDLSRDDIPRVGQIGGLNRIAVRDGQLVIARATANAQAAIATQTGSRSLADDPVYAAAAQMLTAPALDDTGELVGAILMGGAQFDMDPAAMLFGERLTAENAQQFMDQWRQENADRVLPRFDLVAFGTRHSADQGATFLILALVFPPGTDAQAAADAVGARLRDYVSLRIRATLEDRWTFDRAISAEVDGLPVALVVMRAADPLPTPEDEPVARAGVFSWIDLIFARDWGFLVPGPFEDQ